VIAVSDLLNTAIKPHHTRDTLPLIMDTLLSLLPDCLVGDGVAEVDQQQVAADAGDEQAQLSLARHYLELAQLDSDSEPTAKRAVSLLVKASKQGNDEATRLLADCLDKQLGRCTVLKVCHICCHLTSFVE